MMFWWTLQGNIIVYSQSAIQGCVIIYNDKTPKATTPSATANGPSKYHLQHLHRNWTIKGCLILSWWTSQSYITLSSESFKATKPPTTKKDRGWNRHHIMWHPDSGNHLHTWWRYSHEFWCSSYTLYSVLTVFDSPKVGFHKLYS